MTEKYIKLDEALKLIDEAEDILNLQYLDVTIRTVNGEALKALLKQLPAIDVKEGGIRRKYCDYLSVEPPEDKVYVLNDKGAVTMSFETFEMVLNGEITFTTINTRRKFEAGE